MIHGKKLFEQALDMLERGMLGEYKGIPINSMPAVSKMLCNLQRGTYYLVGGDTGSGKTTMVDQMFLFDPFTYINSEYNTNKYKLDILYFSYEITAVRKLIKFITKLLYNVTGKVYSLQHLLSMGDYHLTKDVYEAAIGLFHVMEPFLDVLEVYETPFTATQFEYVIRRHLSLTGKFYKVKETGEETYVANDPSYYRFLILDHVGLASAMGVTNLKGVIDDYSTILVKYRNMVNLSPVVVAQYNRDLSKAQDDKPRPPKLSDFKETGKTQDDCNVAFGIYDPARYRVPEFMQYPIAPAPGTNEGFGDMFRSLHNLKARDGETGWRKALVYHGALGHFIELPKPDVLSAGVKSISEYKILSGKV